MPDFLPVLPVDPTLGILISMILVSLLAGAVALIRHRRALVGSLEDEDTDLGTLFENPQSIMPHLIELRQRVINALIAIIVAGLVAAALVNPILDVLAEPIGGTGNLQVIGVTENVQVWFRIAITFGIILAAPYVISQIWIFVAAGLRPQERRLFYLLFPFAVVLFVAGVSFAYFVMLPVAVPFLTQFLVEATPTLDSYFSFVTTVLIFVGLSFEMPMVVFVMAKAGLVTSQQLVKNWRIAIVGIAALSAFITPTPDPVNMGIVSAPLILLYLLSIVLARFA